MAPLERGYLLTRIYRFVKVLFVIGILLVFGVSLCACSVPQIIEVPENLPDYMKDVYKDIAKQGIKVVYEPEVMEPIPKPTKAYEITVQRNIPENWVVGELDWHGPGIILGLYGNYLLEADSKKVAAGGYLLDKEIYKLYRKKSSNSGTASDILTNSDYTLVEELDKAPDKLPLPVNQGAIMTDQFVVWMASSDGELRDWEIWGYNIGKGKTFLIASNKDYTIPQNRRIFPYWPIIRFDQSGKTLLLNLPMVRGNDGIERSYVIIYDLNEESIFKTITSEDYIYSYPMSVGNYLYANRLKLYQDDEEQTGYERASIVRIDPNSGRDKVIIPETDFHVFDSFRDQLAMVPYVMDYSYQDVWILDTARKELRCYMKSPVTQNNTPGVDLSEKGFFYADGESQASGRYFYSYSKAKAFFVGPKSGPIDSYGRFLIIKQILDRYAPLPPFDYPGKDKALAGYDTFLILQPD